MNHILIHSARLAGSGTAASPDPSGWALNEDGSLVELGAGERWASLVSPGTEVVDAGVDLLAPAFVDVHCHCHGDGGAEFEDADGLDTVLATHRGHVDRNPCRLADDQSPSRASCGRGPARCCHR